MDHPRKRLSQFESVDWTTENDEGGGPVSTPGITPGLLYGQTSTPGSTSKADGGILRGVHYTAASYPAYTGTQDVNTPTSNPSHENIEMRHVPSLTIEHIASMATQIQEVLGFQYYTGVNAFELLMSQLDSRSASSDPDSALVSLHRKYISGVHANFRHWYLACHMDKVDRENERFNRSHDRGFPSFYAASSPQDPLYNESPYLQSPMQSQTTPYWIPETPMYTPRFDDDTNECGDEYSLKDAEHAWELHFASQTHQDRLVDLLIYLQCWTEANLIRNMPECLAFIYKCANDYYNSRFPSFPQNDRSHPDLEHCFFLEKIITPLYKSYRSFSNVQTENGDWIRREGDHKEFIGYDDMNQLFWYEKGLKRLHISRVKAAELDLPTVYTRTSADEREISLVDLPRGHWYLALADVPWDTTFTKTYRELRSWIHCITNFSRIWILHGSIFWFYTAFNSPSLYTIGYDYMDPKPPHEFVRWSIISLGGLFGPLVTLIGLFGEYRFIPRKSPGAKPILPRLIVVSILTLSLAVPIVCNLVLNPWGATVDFDYMPSTVTAFVLFSVAVLYTVFFSFQPVFNDYSGPKISPRSKKSSEKEREFLANRLFTANFANREGGDSTLSYFMCIAILLAKFLESYFFMTLSVRDPIRELGIFDLTDRCLGDQYIIGTLVCKHFPKLMLGFILLTDMILFFLDTYLWYVIMNTLISVSIALKKGTSVWTPWRNVYSQLSQRISTKLLAPSANQSGYNSRISAVCVIWNAIIDSMYRSNMLDHEQAQRLVHTNSVTHEPRFFTMEEDGKNFGGSSAHCSSSAYRRISFFAQSISTTMPTAMSVEEMPSFTVMVPHYKEKIILGLSETIKAETGAKITILEYLQRLYPQEWANYVQTLRSQNQDQTRAFKQDTPMMDTPTSLESDKSNYSSPAYTEPPSASTVSFSFSESLIRTNPISAISLKKPASTLSSPVSYQSYDNHSVRTNRSHRMALQKLGFSTLDPNDTERTRIWCSERTQTLYRTLKGFSNYTTAIKVLHRAEEHAEEASMVTPRSRSQPSAVDHLCQRKFRLIVAMQLYNTFTPKQLQDVETMMAHVPQLVISYVEHDKLEDQYYSCVFDHTCPLLESGKRKPKMRLRLSGSPFLGDGKSDNQNTALPFYRGEYIQLIDANQDNYLEECLKIRNVLMEFENCTPFISNAPNTASFNASPVSEKLGLKAEFESKSNFYYGTSRDVDIEAQNNHISAPTILNPGVAPVAIVGAREYIFSENIGVLGDVAAGKEQTFGTLFSRTLAKVGAKLHYGHPDFLNGIFMTTRGGVSKGQKGLHLNEDIYAGMTALMRGGQIKHCEYYQCGKGRDLGFVSILNFTAKIGAGMGEQMLSREYFYMGTQLPFDRFISFFYAHPGFHLNNVFIMISLQMLLIIVLWISSIVSVKTVCKFDPDLGPTAPQLPAGCKNVMPLIKWVQRCVMSIFLMFFVSLCPLLFQELTEKGLLKSLSRVFRHLGSLSMLFEVFVSRIYARSFWEDINIGGAKYVATGRGLATSRIALQTLYTGYHSELVCGIKIAGILIYSGIVFWNPSYLWFWITAISLGFCPFLYNPHQFAFTDYMLDYRKLLLWFWSSVTPLNEERSWSTFNREVREKITGVKKRQTTGESTRPAFINTVLSEIGTALLNGVCIGIPYVYIGTQQMYRTQEVPETSILLRIAIVSAIPFVVTTCALVTGLIISVTIGNIFSTHSHANPIAFVVHKLGLLGLIVSYWVLYVLESRQFAPTLLGIMTVASVHQIFNTLLTVLVFRRQKSLKNTNDSWWIGKWSHNTWQEIIKAPLWIFEELIAKIVETTQYAYDFLICHFILSIQTPLLVIPYIDTLHTLFLLWLRPRITSAAAESISVQRKRKIRIASRVFTAVYLLTMCSLALLLTFPVYAPSDWVDISEEYITSLTAL